MKKYLIAHDLGTSGNKASLFSTEGELVDSCTIPYDVHFFNKNCAEQDPEDWWKAVCTATKQITKNVDPKDILGISFSSQMQACVVVDKNGQALRPAMIWADLRSEKQAKQLEERVGFDHMNEMTGHRISAAYTLEKLMWIRDNEPEVFEKTYKVLLAKDYIICKLTGEFVTDYSEASGTDAFDLRNLEWSKEIMDAAEIDMSILPELHASTDVIGSLSEDVAAEIGLTTETKVVCGGGDGPCSGLGAGSFKNGQMFLSYGTSAWIAGTCDEMFLDKGRTLICFGHVIPGKYLPCGTMQAAGSSYTYIKNALCKEDEVIAKERGVSVFELLNEHVMRSPAGAKGLIFLPYLLGERSPRWNPDTSGSFLGVKMEHDKSDYIRAVVEGIAMNMAIILEAQREYGPIEELVLTGGGAKGDIVAQVLADVFGIPLHRLDNVESATSIAAAVIAGVGVGVFEDFDVVNQFVKPEKTFTPDLSKKDVYDKQKKLFEAGYQSLLDYYKLDASL